jgi:predicted transcriptional regulator
MYSWQTHAAQRLAYVKPETKKRLARLAKASGRSSNFLIADAVEVYVSDQERMLAEVCQADCQVTCGKQHDDETLCQ